MDTTPFVRVLGSSNWCPTPGCDSSSYTVGDRLLVDTGWYSIPTMINHGINPLKTDCILFTHMHTDHCMALPQVLLYWRVHAHGSLRGLTIAGPKATLREAYRRAYEYAFFDTPGSYPNYGEPTFLELSGGASFERNGYRIETIDSLHAAPGLCYRITHVESGRCVGFSGDTAYRAEYGAFFSGCDLLLHETSFGAGPIDPPEWNAVRKHSSAIEAVRVAKEANVRRLLLTHAPDDRRESAVAQARTLINIPVSWAEPLKVYPF